MHSDRDIELGAQQLEKLRVDGEAYQKTQADVLTKYATLMEDYKRLKSDYEEERDSRERYKQLAKGQERNPFVLVGLHPEGSAPSEGKSRRITSRSLLNCFRMRWC